MRRYWWVNAIPQEWSFTNIDIGETVAYTLYNDNGIKRRVFQNFLDAKVGDMVIGYDISPIKKIVAIGKVAAEQNGNEIYFEKIEKLSSPIDYLTLKKCPKLEQFLQNTRGSFLKLTEDEYNAIINIIRKENPLPIESYTKDDFLNEVYISEEKYDTLVAVFKNKKNIILQGTPGVGKTFAAKRLAYSIMGEQDDSRIEFVQFHQNYSYEDFVMGYKPVENGFKLKYGIFYNFCQKAAADSQRDYFFIIDEINRGNMSKIFGELLMLIEKDYRYPTKIKLTYEPKKDFSVPENLHIIGMMNTADRSLAMIDYALRRRFSFFDMEPAFNSEGFRKYQNELNNNTLNKLIDKVKLLNKEISMDRSLGEGFCIGHSYFCGCKDCDKTWLKSIVEYDILPMLAEYWFDDIEKLQQWESILLGVFND